jgi:hypothetical protein
MCFTLNSAEEWAGSIFQVDTAEVVVVAVMRVCSFSSLWMRGAGYSLQQLFYWFVNLAGTRKRHLAS